MNSQARPEQCSITSDDYPQPYPKLSVGDRVRWFRVSTQDFGTVIDRSYGTEGSVRELGWHYQIQLDPDSPSFNHCKTDYGFKDDLELLQTGGADAAE